MPTFTYPDGSQLTSTAINEEQAQAMFQLVTGQMLGVLMVPYGAQPPGLLSSLPPALAASYGPILARPWQVELTLANGQFTAQASSTALLYANQLVSCMGLPAGTQITNVGPGNTVWLSLPATVNATNLATISDPNCFSAVRQGWQQTGQPAWNIAADICVVRCEPLDTDYGRVHDSTQTLSNITAVFTDVYTRAWRTYWTFYGPNSTDRARAVHSALVTIQQFADLLASANWYVNPSIPQPNRVPELFQGQWWPRADLYADFNEQVTETYTTGTVEQVPVGIYTEAGELAAFTVTTGD
jgi:hypothetical protein